jgi:hypothetical protein
MVYFARAVGAARTGNTARAKADVDRLVELREALLQAPFKDGYWAEQVEIQPRGAAAWLARAEGKPDDALALMRATAELEDSTEKHNITPGPIATARELLGDILLEMNQPAGDRDKARAYYTKLITVAAASDNQRPALVQAKAFLGTK